MQKIEVNSPAAVGLRVMSFAICCLPTSYNLEENKIDNKCTQLYGISHFFLQITNTIVSSYVMEM